MGQRRNWQIEKFAAETGIIAATGVRLEALANISKHATDLIKAIELERSGIRDGDGYWSGCDPIQHIVRDIYDLYEVLGKIERGEESPI